MPVIFFCVSVSFNPYLLLLKGMCFFLNLLYKSMLLCNCTILIFSVIIRSAILLSLANEIFLFAVQYGAEKDI